MDITCPGSDERPSVYNRVNNFTTGWCAHCPDQHVIANAVIPHHNLNS